jgi:hypothetical protein
MGMGKRYVDISLAKISSMENRLSGTLKPVMPRKEFVNRLGQHIQTGYRPTFVNNVTNWHIYALLVAGMVSIAVFLAMIVRGLLENTNRERTA